MIARKTRRLASLRERRPIWGLILATVIAGGIVGACRLTTHLTSLPHTELDGIAFLGLIYWVVSVVGYFTARASAARPRRRRERWPAAMLEANVGREHVRRNSAKRRRASISAVSLRS